MQLIKLHTSGKMQLFECDDSHIYSWNGYTKLLGCEYTELLKCKGCRYSLLLDQEREDHSARVNKLASHLYGDKIVGAVLVGISFGPMFTGIPDAEADAFKEKLSKMKTDTEKEK